MQSTILFVHTVIAAAIIILVLMQRGKGADAGAAFGAGASGTVFGARGSGSFFSRATAILATAFFVTSLALAYMSSQRTSAPDSLIEGTTAVEAEDGTTADEAETIPELPEMDSAEPRDEDGEMPQLDPADQEEDPSE